MDYTFVHGNYVLFLLNWNSRILIVCVLVTGYGTNDRERYQINERQHSARPNE